jgi:hypothetical protein
MLKMFRVALGLVLMSSFTAFAADSTSASFDCGLIQGLASGTRSLRPQMYVETNTYVPLAFYSLFNAMVRTKLEQLGALRDELQTASKKVGKPAIGNGLSDVASSLNGFLTPLPGPGDGSPPVSVLQSKLNELNTATQNAERSLNTMASLICP